MRAEDYIFSVHSIEERDGHEPGSHYEGVNIITFCPVIYWKKNSCLPDFSFADEMSDIPLPQGYQYYVLTEETQWASRKKRVEIVTELSAMGFIENVEMENFLLDCWS